MIQIVDIANGHLTDRPWYRTSVMMNGRVYIYTPATNFWYDPQINEYGFPCTRFPLTKDGVEVKNADIPADAIVQSAFVIGHHNDALLVVFKHYRSNIKSFSIYVPCVDRWYHIMQWELPEPQWAASFNIKLMNHELVTWNGVYAKKWFTASLPHTFPPYKASVTPPRSGHNDDGEAEHENEEDEGANEKNHLAYLNVIASLPPLKWRPLTVTTNSLVIDDCVVLETHT
jgi:hypothetical protein